METKANYVVVGIFTVFAVLAAFAFVYWTAAVGDRGETAVLRVRIPGSASGLGRGSAVLFNGIKVGDVQRVYIDPSNPNAAIADTAVDRLTPITRSTRADIGLAGLTGQANIELKGGDAQEVRLLEEADQTGKVAEITANPSAVTNLLQTAQDIFKRADSVITNLEGFVTEARAPLTETVNNAEKFSQALADNADGIDKFLESVSSLSTQLQAVSGQLDSTLSSAKGLLDAVDKERIAQIVQNTETLTRNLNETSGRLDGIVNDVNGAVKSVTDLAGQARGTLERVDGIVAAVDPESIKTVVADVKAATSQAGDVIANFRDASQSAKDLLAVVDKERVERIVQSTESLTKNLDTASGRIDTVVSGINSAVDTISGVAGDARGTLAKVDVILEGVDPDSVRTIIADIKSATSQAGEAIGNFRTASESANEAASDVARFTEKFAARSDDVDKMITDAQQLAQRLNSASVRVDGILVKVDNLLGSGEAEGVMVDLRETLDAYKKVADTLNSRLGTITDGLARFSGQGLRDVQALVGDSRRAIGRIESAISDLERNPSRIISGGDGTVRQYDGRARR